jgi:hypothetical protein
MSCPGCFQLTPKVNNLTQQLNNAYALMDQLARHLQQTNADVAQFKKHVNYELSKLAAVHEMKTLEQHMDRRLAPLEVLTEKHSAPIVTPTAFRTERGQAVVYGMDGYQTKDGKPVVSTGRKDADGNFIFKDA